MTLDLTIAICTYNGATRLPQVIEKLRGQIGVEDLKWEILVIDNNSSDATRGVVRQQQQFRAEGWRLRYCFEPEQGLAIARHRAVTEARGNLVGFLDDDNIPAPNWVAEACRFGQAHPQIGAYGSQIFGDFAGPTPANFSRIAPLLALTDRGPSPIPYKPQRKVLPPGAGLVVRRQVWLEHVPAQCFLQGRSSGLKLPGEDLEALLHIQQSGWAIWYNPTMQLHHQIPTWRLERDYLTDLCHRVGLSRFHTRRLSLRGWQYPVMLPAYVANDLRKIVQHLLRYRLQAKTDVVVACELALFVGSLLSPFYLGKAYLKTLWHKARSVESRPVSREPTC